MGDNKLQKGVSMVILGIVLLVMVVSIIGATVTTVDSAGDDITQDQRCTDGGCFFNATRTLDCTANNETSVDTTACSVAHSNTAFALEGLFNTGGVVTLLFLGSALVLTVGLAFKYIKHK